MGGGIPSSLKTDMNAVLNKKFGTSTTYAPDTWAPNVNLMGPLPEKTASGSIAHIEDGADTVPIKAWDVTVDANLDGVSSIEVTQAGKNLLDESKPDVESLNNRITVTYNNGVLTLTNNAGGSSHRCAYDLYGMKVKDFLGKTITFSLKVLSRSAGFSSNGQIQIGEENNYYARTDITGTGTFSVSYTVNTAIDKVLYFKIYPQVASLPNGEVMTCSELQVEISSAPTAFEAFDADVTTVPLGRTIYGGSADVVNGTGTDENGNDFTFTPMNPTPQTPLGTSNFWADTGDSEVTYRADIDLIINALNNNRGLMMRPINTEEIEFEEEENSDESNR